MDYGYIKSTYMAYIDNLSMLSRFYAIYLANPDQVRKTQEPGFFVLSQKLFSSF